MKEVIHPSRALEGTVILPGDKSISHRYAMLASLAEGVTRISNYSSGADCHSTLGCLRTLGVPVTVQGREVTIEGKGLRSYTPAAAGLDAGNSGSTIRMLAGILAAQDFTTRIAGDESLSKRPMERIMRPLTEMGATFSARDGKYPPVEIHGAGTGLRAIDYTMPVASAQVKSCVLLAGLHVDADTTVREPAKTRDHTEVALRELGVDVRAGRGTVTIRGGRNFAAKDLAVPGDLSSAAFFLAAGAMAPESNLLIAGVGLNPTRATLIDFLVGAGASVKVVDMGMKHGEPVGTLLVRGSKIKGGVIEGQQAAALIDEIPVLAVLGAVSENGLLVRDAAELRIKETDRIETLAENLRRMGAVIEVAPDGFRIPGKQTFHAAETDSFGDHRIAMAFAVAALSADGPCTIQNSEAASVSFPEFWDTLRQISR
ncbi:MAG: 3-phosphoshikimate 1-carboxyvinyltransferase [Bryobacterales bacterium]|nr:3-phosphoshikimate 1-carboxyvinyltransferase [Bryobacterales bacterium]